MQTLISLHMFMCTFLVFKWQIRWLCIWLHMVSAYGVRWKLDPSFFSLGNLLVYFRMKNMFLSSFICRFYVRFPENFQTGLLFGCWSNDFGCILVGQRSSLQTEPVLSWPGRHDWARSNPFLEIFPRRSQLFQSPAARFYVLSDCANRAQGYRIFDCRGATYGAVKVKDKRLKIRLIRQWRLCHTLWGSGRPMQLSMYMPSTMPWWCGCALA